MELVENEIDFEKKTHKSEREKMKEKIASSKRVKDMNS
jgi:hypothetical protein